MGLGLGFGFGFGFGFRVRVRVMVRGSWRHHLKKPHRAAPVSAAQPQKCRPWLGPSLETVQSLASAPQLQGGVALAPSSWCRPSMLDTCAGKCASLKSGAWAVFAPSAFMVAAWQAVAQAALARRQRRAPRRREVCGEVNEEGRPHFTHELY